MAVMGRVVGVLHSVAARGQPLSEEAEAQLEAIANQVGGRLGMVRTVVSMQVQASTDPLTGLLNRRSFEAACTPILASDRPFALAMADLDHFKRLNDAYGHEAGDRALRAFARVLRTSLRADDIVGRIGGEEFCIVMPDCSVDAAARALEGVRLALASAIARSGVPPVTVSIGVVDGRRADDLEALTSLGDKALYEAKRAGRDRIVVSGRGEVSPDASSRQPQEPLLAVVADARGYADHA
jgi:diguanylate cyclase (GGDEF)-like protein